MEAPAMLVVIVFSARRGVRRFALVPNPEIRLGTGLLALTPMLAAEFCFVLRLRGPTIAEYLKPNTSKPFLAHKIDPYLLLAMAIDAPNCVWCADVCTSRCAGGFSISWRSLKYECVCLHTFETGRQAKIGTC